jgi:hypothetical protein
MRNRNISHIAHLSGTTDLLLWQVLKMNHQLYDCLARRVRKISEGVGGGED